MKEVLAWYRDAGVDEALHEMPVDRFAESERIAAARAKRSDERSRMAPAVALERGSPPKMQDRGAVRALSADAVASQAVELANGCTDLVALREAITNFEGSALKRTARSMVFAAGDPASRLAIIGDVPDRDEDGAAEPFAGLAGELLDKMLQAIGLTRSDAYLLNASPWRTPGQRQLNPQEKASLAPLLVRHVELTNAKFVLAMGGAATELMVGSGKRFPALRGQWQTLAAGEREVSLLATFHPNVLMRQAELKRLAWIDMLTLRQRL